MFQNKIQISVP